MTISKILGCESLINIRPRTDFYETPGACTVALMREEDKYLPQVLWEPFFGNGAIAVWLMNGHGVYCSDLNPHQLNSPIMPDALRVDFLLERKLPQPEIRGIVSNPPYTLAHKIIEHALDIIQIQYLALLLKADFLNSNRSYKLFKKFRPARIHALSWRPDFKNQGAPVMNCSWFVWDGHPEYTLFNVIGKP